MNFYRDATWVYDYVQQEDARGQMSGSVHSLVLKSCHQYKLKSNPKHIFAVVNSCWLYAPYLTKIMKRSGILDNIPKKKGKPIYAKTTLMLLCHDLLFSKSKRIQMGKHPIKDYVFKYRSPLHSELVRLKLKLKVKGLSQLINTSSLANGGNTDDIPPVRWFRINPLRCDDMDAVIQELSKKFPQKVDNWKDIVPGTIYQDEYIPNLFGVAPQDKITSHELYKQGKIIIQDRASCFPAHILSPGEHDIIIDACAAPGNKTTHVAAHIYPNATKRKNALAQIHAFEKNPERAETLKKMVTTAGCASNTQIHVGDFTKLAIPEKFPNVTGFIVDPSCSGSGIFGRKQMDLHNKAKAAKASTSDDSDNDNVPNEDDNQQEQKENELAARLSKLSSFQFQMVKHAMAFPKAKKIVYSTCSIHAEENEQVVIDLLSDRDVQKAGWQIAPRAHVIPTWPRRGLLKEFTDVFRDESIEKCQEMADGCIRALPREDGGIGFFAVCFSRD